MAKPILLLLFFLTTSIIISTTIATGTINCCLEAYTSFGESCVNGLTYENVSYYCMKTSEACGSCSLSSSYSDSNCVRCCVTSKAVCSDDDAILNLSTYFSAWSKSPLFFSLPFFFTLF